MTPLDLLLYSLAVAVGITVAAFGIGSSITVMDYLDAWFMEIRNNRINEQIRRERDAESRGRF